MEYYAHIDVESNVWDYEQGFVLASAEPDSAPASFSATSAEALRSNGGDADPSLCGVTRCGGAAWLAAGSHLEVTSTRTGERLAAQTFAVPNSGFNPRIMHCVEVHHPRAILLFAVRSCVALSPGGACWY